MDVNTRLNLDSSRLAHVQDSAYALPSTQALFRKASALGGEQSVVLAENAHFDADALMAKSVYGGDSGGSTAHAVPHSSADGKARADTARGQTAGAGWFDMPAPELTRELRNDLRVLRQRQHLDPKRFYKSMGAVDESDAAAATAARGKRSTDNKKKKKKSDATPKFFQVGTVVEAPHEFNTRQRLKRRQRKSRLLDEVMGDQGVRHFARRRFLDVQRRTQRAAAQTAKRKSGAKRGGKKPRSGGR